VNMSSRGGANISIISQASLTRRLVDPVEGCV
jgi:hypothetical protein